MEGTILTDVSLIHHARGDYGTALSCLEKSLSIGRRIGDASEIAKTLYIMGTIFWEEQKDVKRAVLALMEAHHTLYQIGSSDAKYLENYLDVIIEEIGKERFEEILQQLQNPS
ncbi:MAG: tetratricopeptide repeat protein [Bacteroidota bacterium]